LIVAKNNYTSARYGVYGNHALDNDNYNDYIDTKVETKANHKKIRIMKLIKRLKVLICVFLMLCTGLFIVSRYVVIMNLNSQSRAIKAEIVKYEKENENLNMELSTYCDIKQIEKVASTELNMIHPSLSNTVSINSMNINQDINVVKKDSQDKISGFIGMVLSYFN
jgi:cell division protein FtsL